MSPREAFSTWLQRHFLALVVYILGLGVGIGAVRAEVAQKADHAEVESLRTTMREVNERTKRIERFLCQGRASDLGCQQ